MNRFVMHLGFFLLSFVAHYYIWDGLDHLRGGNLDLGLIKIQSILNNAFIFGLFERASHFIRIVTSTVLIGIVTILSCYFYAFLSSELRTLRWGMTVMLTGLCGNAFEKLYFGFVQDYISINIGYLSQFYFNLSDVLQIVGLAIIVKEIFQNQDMIWLPDVSKRKRVFVYREIQLPMTSKILGLFFIGSITQGILAMTLLFPQLKRGSQDIQVLFIFCLILINVAILPLIGKFFLREQLRSMGPVYALEKYMQNEALPEKPLKFRTSDHFKSLEETFNRFVDKHIRSKSP